MERFPKTEELLECDLTPEELIAKGGDLSRKNQEKSRLDDEKKTITSEFKAKIDACDAEINKLALVISTKKESRRVKCETRYNTPEKHLKSLVRLDKGETVKIAPMTQEEICDLFINGLGDQGDRFVFKTEFECPIIDRKDINENDTDWESRTKAVQDYELVNEGIDKNSTASFRVLRGEDNMYMLQEEKRSPKGKE